MGAVSGKAGRCSRLRKWGRVPKSPVHAGQSIMAVAMAAHPSFFTSYVFIQRGGLPRFRHQNTLRSRTAYDVHDENVATLRLQRCPSGSRTAAPWGAAMSGRSWISALLASGGKRRRGSQVRSNAFRSGVVAEPTLRSAAADQNRPNRPVELIQLVGSNALAYLAVTPAAGVYAVTGEQGHRYLPQPAPAVRRERLVRLPTAFSLCRPGKVIGEQLPMPSRQQGQCSPPVSSDRMATQRAIMIYHLPRPETAAAAHHHNVNRSDLSMRHRRAHDLPFNMATPVVGCRY